MMNHHSGTLMWHVSLAKCEKDLDDKIQFWRKKKKCFNLKLIFNDKNYSKFNVFPHLRF
jgi:hypothetical protein